MRDTEVAASNAVTLAQAVTAVATEIARTGIDVASITVTRAYGPGTPIGVRVQVVRTADLAPVARLFPGLPLNPIMYGDVTNPSACYEGHWIGMGVDVDVYGRAIERRVSA